jgi:hypothetical protein
MGKAVSGNAGEMTSSLAHCSPQWVLDVILRD